MKLEKNLIHSNINIQILLYIQLYISIYSIYIDVTFPTRNALFRTYSFLSFVIKKIIISVWLGRIEKVEVKAKRAKTMARAAEAHFLSYIRWTARHVSTVPHLLIFPSMASHLQQETDRQHHFTQFFFN